MAIAYELGGQGGGGGGVGVSEQASKRTIDLNTTDGGGSVFTWLEPASRATLNRAGKG